MVETAGESSDQESGSWRWPKSLVQPRALANLTEDVSFGGGSLGFGRTPAGSRNVASSPHSAKVSASRPNNNAVRGAVLCSLGLPGFTLHRLFLFPAHSANLPLTKGGTSTCA
jgi:hypothetical protein